MNHEYIEKNNIVERYLRGTLSPEESTEFEQYFLDKPDLLEQLELDHLLYQQLPQAEVIKDKSWGYIVWEHLFGSPVKSLTMIACTCLLSVLVVVGILHEPDMVTGSGQVVYTDTYRSNQPQKRVNIELQQGVENLVLVTPVEVFNQHYRVVVVEEDNGRELLNNNTWVNADGELTIVLPVELLKSGNYVLKVSAIEQNTPNQNKEVLLLIE